MGITVTRRRVLSCAAVVALVSALAGCGSSTPSGPSTPATTTTVVQQGTFQLVSVQTANGLGVSFDAARTEFTISSSGTLQAVVDWTFSSNALGIGIFRGSCSFDQFYANVCNQIAGQAATNSKRRSA